MSNELINFVNSRTTLIIAQQVGYNLISPTLFTEKCAAIKQLKQLKARNGVRNLILKLAKAYSFWRNHRRFVNGS